MAIILDKIILLLFCAFTLIFIPNKLITVVCVLIAISVSSFCYYFHSAKAASILLFIYYGLCFINPIFCLFLPLLAYDIALYKLKYTGIVGVLVLVQYTHLNSIYAIILFVFITITSLIMQYRSEKYDKLQNDYKRLRDTSAELNMYLSNKNRMLIENQDNEIHLVMLKERNRIAREIHDNVGHMLSRSLLQVGALMAICKDDVISPNLVSLLETLNDAMNSIRESVHDLYDDSIDLYLNINNVINKFSNYKVSFDYDMSNHVSKNIKYCFIMIVKEAFSNVAKHSNADSITIIVREHPVFYQLLIKDNGTKTNAKVSDEGIGLENMKARVINLNGNITINNNAGFKIFISIPKKNNEEEGEYR